ncbi:DUF3905 domain-containing protein [Paenibacillus contaminans]|uniref:DUF3905 domain-containing protein n=1 Tax=Paenibacillus contaminans TaxID=450362 RepID=A0A329M905_9BACL|nr:DUF3905 domain-containing protein [Paenibacillus contaminans]RAV16380.1 DUF3905 domain-containing protein [Paenibacillus contaminans]
MTSEQTGKQTNAHGNQETAEAQPEAVTKDRSDLDPFEINFLPEFRQGRGPQEPFVNEHGVLIGDHDYESSNSPLEQWTENTDPAVMSGDEWVHPFKDVGFQTSENRDYFERGITPQTGMFMHPDKNASYDLGSVKEPDDASDDPAENRE